MKKAIPIIVIVGAILAIIAIGYFGSTSFRKDTVFVSSIRINDELDEDGAIYLDYDNNQRTWAIDYSVLPLDADNKEVTFSSSNEEAVSVDQDGNVTMHVAAGATITIRAKDGSNVSSRVIFRPIISSQLVNVEYDFEANTVSDTGQNYFMEGNTLVVFAHNPFMFDYGSIPVTIDGNTDVVTLEDYTFTPTGAGNFTINFGEDEDVKSLNVKVIDYITSIGFDGGYADYRNATNDDFMNTNVTYEVGHGSDFILPLIIEKTEGSKQVRTSRFEIEVKLEVKVDGEYVLVEDLSEYLENSISDEPRFKFKEEAEGKTFRLGVRAQYRDIPGRTIEFIVNEGVNVNNHEELRLAFEDASVSKINIHKEIIVDASENVYTDTPLNPQLEGTLINAHSRITNEESPDFGKTGHIYYREVSKGSISIVGNLQTIDGTDIPKSILHTSDGANKFYEGVVEFPAETAHINVQSSIFRFMRDDAYPDAEFSISNLKIVGNTQSSRNALDSGGIHLIYASNSSSTATNTYSNLNLSGAVIALFMSTDDTTHLINEVMVSETYNSGMTLWSADVEITNSKFRRNGGAAIQLIDDKADENIFPKLTIDEYTLSNIQNWTFGDEGWFTGFGGELLALQLKSQLDAGVELYNKTIVRNKEVGETVEEEFNFKIIIQSDNPFTSDVTNPKGRIVIIDEEGNTVHTFEREHNFADTFQTISGLPAYAGPLKEEYYNLLVKSAYGSLTPEEEARFIDYSTEDVEFVIPGQAGLNSQISIILEWLDRN